jgi:hypothetical protein
MPTHRDVWIAWIARFAAAPGKRSETEEPDCE